MPTLELRVVDFDNFDDPKFLEFLREVQPDTISVGSESCYLQLPTLEKLNAILGALEPFRTKFVVPMLFESHFDRVLPLIDAAAGRVDVVAVNDYGALQYLRRRHSDKVARVALSSGLSYSYEQCPWHGHIVRDQCDVVKKAMLRSNLDNAWMCDFLTRFPFAFDVELPALPGMVSSSPALKKQGFRVAVLADAVPVSCSRACHTARHFGVSPDRCGRVCRTPAVLDATHRWDFFQGDVKEIDPVVREQMPKLIVWGNMIYIENTQAGRDKALREADCVIFDTKFYPDRNRLAKAIADMRAGRLGDSSHVHSQLPSISLSRAVLGDVP